MKLIPAFVILNSDNEVLTYDDVRQQLPGGFRMLLNSLENKYLAGETGVNGAFISDTALIPESLWEDLSEQEGVYIAPVVIPECADKRFFTEPEMGMTIGLNSTDVEPNLVILEENVRTATTFINDPGQEDGILVYAKPSMVFYKDSAYWGSTLSRESLFIPSAPPEPTPPWVVPQPIAMDIHQFADKPQDIHQFADKPQDIHQFADVPVPGYAPPPTPPQKIPEQYFPKPPTLAFGHEPAMPAPTAPVKTAEEANREMLSTISSMFPMFQ